MYTFGLEGSDNGLMLCSVIFKSLSIGRQRYDFSLKYLIFANNVDVTEMKNNVHRIFSIVFLAALLALGGCARLSQVRPTSVKLDSVSPRGMRALVLNVSVGVHNPAQQISLSEISGEVLVSGKVIGNVAVDPLTLAARADSTYAVKADVTLAEGVSVMQVLALAGKKGALDEASANISAKAKLKSGPAKKLKMDNIPLKKLLELL